MKPRNHEAVASIVNDLSGKIGQFGMTIQDFTVLGSNLVSVTASVNRVDEAAIADELAKQTETSVALVPGSVREVQNHRQITARFFATPNVRVESATKERLENLIEINANVYADEETNSIWRLDGEGDDQVLVQQSSDNLEEIFNARKTRRMQASHQYDGIPAFAAGDFAAYASVAGSVRCGMLYETDAGWHIFDYDHRSRVDINPKQVICAAVTEDDEDELNITELVANLATKQGTEILNYYRKLYGSNPSFFSRLSKLVKDYNGKVQLNDTNPDVNEMLRNNVR